MENESRTAWSWVRGDADSSSLLTALGRTGTDRDWCDAVLAGCTRFFACNAGAALVMVEHTAEMSAAKAVFARGVGSTASAVAEATAEFVAHAAPEVRRAFLSPDMPATTDGEVERALSAAGRSSGASWSRALGAVDGLRLTTAPEPGLAVVLYVPLRTTRPIDVRERGCLLRVAARLENAARLRRRPESVLAVLDADGCEVQRAPRTFDLWRGLCDGRASVVERAHEGRFVVLGNHASARATQRLTALEAEAVQQAARGASNKLIAYELAVAPSAVSAAVGRAAEKLGFSTRTNLIKIAARLLGDPAPRVDLDVLTPAEREVLELVRRGYSNREIARARGRSDRTVANQIASILGKTESPGRRALVARG